MTRWNGDRTSGSAFLDAVCRGNTDLRNEVESLLAEFENGNSFLESPVVGVTSKASGSWRLSNDQIISHFRIISPIASGGMGEVYLAEDQKLRRQVALKVLPEHMSPDKDRMRRFQREARAVSQLNHPNILTIFEFDEENLMHMFASEFVQGETLRERLKRGRLPVAEVLDIGIQIASALQAAHAAGIVHRDIKPENIMIREDGVVKLLDFGLAKLIAQPFGDLETKTKTTHTQPGLIMGTATYMSPEQARAGTIDARSDLFSFGIVLFEMLTGHVPFEGETMSDVIAALLQQTPRRVGSYNSSIPVELDRLIAKCLEKDREERCQAAADLLADLRSIAKRHESTDEALMKRTFPPADGVPTELISERRRRRRPSQRLGFIAAGVTVALVLFALVLVGIAALGDLSFLHKQKTEISFESAKIRRLTTSGMVFEAQMSPDGKFVAYSHFDGDRMSLWLRQVAAPNAVKILPDSEFWIYGLTFSPDSNYLYYVTRTGNTSTMTLYRVPVLGGEARKLPYVTNSLVTFSPDGKEMAFFRYLSDGEGKPVLTIANIDGTGERELAYAGDRMVFTDWSFAYLAWSPDGKTIAVGVSEPGLTEGKICAVSVATGEINFFAGEEWRTTGQFDWAPDNKSILVTARNRNDRGHQLWQISYPNGEARQLTNELNVYRGASLTASADVLMTVVRQYSANIWISPVGTREQAKPITQGTSLKSDPAWTPDGRIVFSAGDAFLTDASGANSKQITDFGSISTLSVSSNGQIVFDARRNDKSTIYKMDMNGDDLTTLSNENEYASSPSITSDGQWVVYSVSQGSTSLPEILKRVSIQGGQSIPVMNAGLCSDPAVSPDGNYIACNYSDSIDSTSTLAIVALKIGTPVKIFKSLESSTHFCWSPDGQTIFYDNSIDSVSNIWAQPIKGGSPWRVTNFTSDQIFGFDVSRDGKQLVISRGTSSNDVVLISDFK